MTISIFAQFTNLLYTHSPLESAQAPAGKHKREAESSVEVNGAPPTKKGRPAASDGEPLEDYTKLNSGSSESKPKQVTVGDR